MKDMSTKVLGGYSATSNVIKEKKLRLLKKMNIRMSIAANRTTKELVGYWTPKGKSIGIAVTGYAVDDLQKKFDAAADIYKAEHGLVGLEKVKSKEGKIVI